MRPSHRNGAKFGDRSTGFPGAQVKVFRYNRVSEHHQTAALPGFLEDLQKEIPTPRRTQPRPPVIAAAGNEMQMLGPVVSLQLGRHSIRLSRLGG